MSYSTVVAADTPISWWKLTEPSGTTAADSAGANTGTYTNTSFITLGQTGIPGDFPNTCAKFQTTGYVNIGTPTTAIPSTGAYSLECWVKIPIGGVMTAQAQGIFGYGNYGSSNQVNVLKFNNGSGGSAPGVGTTNYWWANDVDWTIPDVRDGIWHHLVASWDLTKRYFYFDGSLVTAGVNSSGMNASQQKLTIASTNNLSDYFPSDSYLQHPAIYGYDLGATKVLAHYNAGIASTTLFRRTLTPRVGSRGVMQ